ncbi:Hypothetical_protein [Hexamita inflata]|uniref:Hypothetical_protein n=1 Tax=Hexamita inflata TaxID=28002 RepID=A0AA86V5R7_9EUKA|nr:Hypothetical protein HINF_LOCUS65116 [Hexamita inflata]
MGQSLSLEQISTNIQKIYPDSVHDDHLLLMRCVLALFECLQTIRAESDFTEISVATHIATRFTELGILCNLLSSDQLEQTASHQYQLYENDKLNEQNPCVIKAEINTIWFNVCAYDQIRISIRENVRVPFYNICVYDNKSIVHELFDLKTSLFTPNRFEYYFQLIESLFYLELILDTEFDQQVINEFKHYLICKKFAFDPFSFTCKQLLGVVQIEMQFAETENIYEFSENTFQTELLKRIKNKDKLFIVKHKFAEGEILKNFVDQEHVASYNGNIIKLDIIQSDYISYLQIKYQQLKAKQSRPKSPLTSKQQQNRPDEAIPSIQRRFEPKTCFWYNTLDKGEQQNYMRCLAGEINNQYANAQADIVELQPYANAADISVERIMRLKNLQKLLQNNSNCFQIYKIVVQTAAKCEYDKESKYFDEVFFDNKYNELTLNQLMQFALQINGFQCFTQQTVGTQLYVKYKEEFACAHLERSVLYYKQFNKLSYRFVNQNFKQFTLNNIEIRPVLTETYFAQNLLVYPNTILTSQIISMSQFESNIEVLVQNQKVLECKKYLEQRLQVEMLNRPELFCDPFKITATTTTSG